MPDRPKKKSPARAVSEAAVERHLVAAVTARGGIAEKTHAVGRRGFFDRVVILPGGIVVFCELKRPRGGVVSPHQRRRHADYARVGARVAVLASKSEVDAFLASLDGASLES